MEPHRVTVVPAPRGAFGPALAPWGLIGALLGFAGPPWDRLGVAKSRCTCAAKSRWGHQGALTG
eukprot:9317447-Pyramimonas_sp.AAC.1